MANTKTGMTKKQLQDLAKKINKVTGLEDDDKIDHLQGVDDLEQELIDVVGGEEPELDIQPDDEFTPKEWEKLASLGCLVAKDKLEGGDDDDDDSETDSSDEEEAVESEEDNSDEDDDSDEGEEDGDDEDEDDDDEEDDDDDEDEDDEYIYGHYADKSTFGSIPKKLFKEVE